MADIEKPLFKKNETHSVVFEYRPREFPVVMSGPAIEFVKSSHDKHSDFKLNDLVAEQVGIAQAHRKTIEDRVEEQALERLKHVEEKAYKEAYELGLIEGREKAFQESQQQLQERMAKLDAVLASFDEIKQQLLKENEVQFLQLISAIATKIAVKEVKADRNIIIQLMSDVVEEGQTTENVTIKLSPEDIAFIESVREKLGKKGDFLKHVKLEPSDEIESGGCIMETNYGVIDATLQERINRIWETLEKKMPLSSHGIVPAVEDEPPSDEPKKEEPTDGDS